MSERSEIFIGLLINEKLNLENQIKNLEKELEEKNWEIKELKNRITSQDDMEELGGKRTRSMVRQEVINRIKKQYINATAEVATRENGNGIIVKNMEREYRIDFYYSKNYADKGGVHCWYTIKKENLERKINKQDYLIFTTYYEEELKTMVFTPEKLMDLIIKGNIQVDKKSNRYHLEFSISNRDGKEVVEEIRSKTKLNMPLNLDNLDL